MDIIEAEQLHARLGDPSLVVFDCRHQLQDPNAGREEYGRGHIPGAHFAHLDLDLAGPVTPTSGRHPLPTPDRFGAWLGHHGVDPSRLVVAYDHGPGPFAARLWWMATACGISAAVLNGGLARWKSLSLPLDAHAPPNPTPKAPIVPAWDAYCVELSPTSATSVMPKRLIDARAPARFRGEEEPIDPVAGHIPGAHNMPWQENLAPDGRLLDPASLRQRWETQLGETPSQVVHYCGSGVTACHNLWATRVAGFEMGRLYPGSWSQWCANTNRSE